MPLLEDLASDLSSDPSSIDEKKDRSRLAGSGQVAGGKPATGRLCQAGLQKNEGGRPASRLLGLQANKPICSNTLTRDSAVVRYLVPSVIAPLDTATARLACAIVRPIGAGAADQPA